MNSLGYVFLLWHLLIGEKRAHEAYDVFIFVHISRVMDGGGGEQRRHVGDGVSVFIRHSKGGRGFRRHER